MTHYQKLATMIFRLIGLITLMMSLFLMMLAFLIATFAMDPLKIFIVFLPYFIGGAISFGLSRHLAKIVCYDFDKSDE